MSVDLLTKLLKTVHQFYPVGLPHVDDLYEGTQKLKEIIRDKIDDIIAHKQTPWTETVAALNARYEGQVFDMAYLQFPCYQLQIVICDHKSEAFTFSRKLLLNLSLLGPFYTAFFEDHYQFNGFVDSVNLPPSFYIFFTQHSHQLQEDLMLIQNIVSATFPTYTFIDHCLLFQHRVDGVHNITEGSYTNKTSHNFYQLLFDGFFSKEHYEVKK